MLTAVPMPMPMVVPIVERAFQLARSGRFASIQAIAAALQAEGYFEVDEHIYACPLLRQQLRRAYRAAALAPGPQPEPAGAGKVHAAA